MIKLPKREKFSSFCIRSKENNDILEIVTKMSPMQGCELSNKISTINPNIKVIIITTYDNVINNDLNLEIVKKPITNTNLLEIIHHYMN